MATEVNGLADQATRAIAARPPLVRSEPAPPPPEPTQPARDPIGTQLGLQGEPAQAQRADAQRLGETLQTATEQVGRAQAAEAELDQGISALERLGELSRAAEADPGASPARSREASEIGERLRNTDRGETLQRVRRDVDTETARRDLAQAEEAVERLDVLPPRPELAQQPTLALVPRLTGGEAERARAEQAVDTARQDLARVESSGRASTAGGPVLEPVTIDVESAPGAAATGAAVEVALTRSTNLRDQVKLLGGEAAARAKGASADRRGPAIPDAQRAVNAANQAARTTVENPAQALTGQVPSVAAALRVLA